MLMGKALWRNVSVPSCSQLEQKYVFFFFFFNKCNFQTLVTVHYQFILSSKIFDLKPALAYNLTFGIYITVSYGFLTQSKILFSPFSTFLDIGFRHCPQFLDIGSK